MKIIPVILSGGSGKRLWPLSRKQFPKQYQSLVTQNTMLQETILRLDGLENLAHPIVICNSSHRFIVAEQLKQINVFNSTILLEPIGRNTAPAIAAAAAYVLKNKENNDAMLLILSADHIIQDTSAFHNAINIAQTQAKKGRVVTFGITPLNANTEYGYIHTEPSNDIDSALRVKLFKEKPNEERANQYLRENEKLIAQNLTINWYWNSGIFMFLAKTLIKELTEFAFEIADAGSRAIDNSIQDLDFVRLERKSFESSPAESIDYALLEKSKNVVVIPLDANWSDIGSWVLMDHISTKDVDNNFIKGDVLTKETSNCYINAGHHLMVAIGVKDLIVVDTPNATLISTKEKAHLVSEIVENLHQQNRHEWSNHRKVYRPWGWYDSIESGEYFQVKRLHINPGAKLSLQMHHKRAEHWVVVSGIASITNGENKITLNQGESTFIPLGVKHDLKNKTNKSLEIIEVQSGSYLGEDDIIRFNDIYGRASS